MSLHLQRRTPRGLFATHLFNLGQVSVLRRPPPLRDTAFASWHGGQPCGSRPMLASHVLMA